MRIVVVTENASMRMSGETALALYYFRFMRRRGHDVHLVCHARCRDELRASFDAESFARMHFVEDSAFQHWLWRAFEGAPERLRGLLLGQLIHLLTQRRARRVVKELVKSHGMEIVYEPAPISPKGLSCMYDVRAPVVVGPFCGGLEFPEAFRYMDPWHAKLGVLLGRLVAPVLHRLYPGKLHADSIIASNERSRRALPGGCRGKPYTLIESGVDLSLWQPRARPERAPGEPIRFVYFARFVDWKGIEFLVEAFPEVLRHAPAVLELMGDGELYDRTVAQVARLGIGEHVNFHGRVPLEVGEEVIRGCDVYMAPSLRECGGLALLEAMALGIPVISVNWAGPAEYLDESCGILVEPSSPEAFVSGLSEAMIRLAESPELRLRLGEGGTRRVRTRCFDWDAKTDRVLEILRETLQRAGCAALLCLNPCAGSLLAFLEGGLL